MNYQISYLSPQGHAKELAYSFRRILPSHTPIIDLSKTSSKEGDLHLVGFEFTSLEFGTIPAPVQQFIRELENKELLLFATCPICVETTLQEQIERKMLPLLPKMCKFHGLFLCQGEVYITVMDELAKLVSLQKENSETKQLLQQYRKGRGHPNREDIRKGYRFISSAIQLDTYL